MTVRSSQATRGRVATVTWARTASRSLPMIGWQKTGQSLTVSQVWLQNTCSVEVAILVQETRMHGCALHQAQCPVHKQTNQNDLHSHADRQCMLMAAWRSRDFSAAQGGTYADGRCHAAAITHAHAGLSCILHLFEVVDCAWS
jgi:hypothetical protein